MKYDDLKHDYQTKFSNMVIDSSRTDEINWYCSKILSERSQYELVEMQTNVPWYVVAIIHGLEAGFDFSSCLHNGQPWNKKTTMVPRGRGPWKSWTDAAVDAVKYDGLDLIDYDCIEKCLYVFEKYNGFGYQMRHVPSPYLYAGSNQYRSGKFVEIPFLPSRYSASTVSKQIGAAVILKRLIQSGHVNFDRTVAADPLPDVVVDVAKTSDDERSFIDVAWLWLKSLFLI